MFRFFTPRTKVQKDRAIMRETDARLAKYSRRGLLFNFLAFLLCLTGGNFVEKEQGLAIVLTVGLLLITLLRGFFLFRFEALYPRGPTRWRNSYFLATLLGASWWGFILVSVTLVLKMQDEAPLLWLYTVVFFSTTAHAFAPYQNFLRIYQFVGLVPAALAAFFIPDVNAYLYGLLLIVFYMILVHQCQLMSEDYWQRLAATYALAKKTENLEEEKRDTRATVQLNQEFMHNLHAELSEVVELTASGLQTLQQDGQLSQVVERLEYAQEFQARIFSSVDDFRGLLNKELTLESRVFNIRHELQALIGDAVDDAEDRHILLESALSPTIPMRLEGDALRFAQIIRTLLATVMQNANNCCVLVEADFLREFEASGDLQVVVSRQLQSKKRLFQSDAGETVLGSLDLSVCKGLADSMNGTLTVTEDQKGNHQLCFRAKFNIPEADNQIDFHKDIFAGHSILVVHPISSLTAVKRRELDALGLSVRTESQFRRAYQTLLHSYSENAPIESILFYIEAHNQEAVEFSRTLLEHKELRHTHQLITCAATTRERSDVQELMREEQYVHFLPQPAGLYELGTSLYQIYAPDAVVKGELPEQDKNLRVLFIDTQHGSSDFGADQLEIAGAEVNVVSMDRLDRQHLDGHGYDLVVMECRSSQSRCSRVIDRIRAFEKEMHHSSLLPIIGVGTDKIRNFYELGFDHFIDLNQQPLRLETTLRYWGRM